MMKIHGIDSCDQTIRSIDSLLSIAKHYQTFLFDQWGVLHNGVTLYPHVNATLDKLAQLNKQIIILSNSGKPAEINRQRLLTMGLLPQFTQHIVTSGDVARWALSAKHKKVNTFISKKMIWLDSDHQSLEGVDQDFTRLDDYQAVVLAGLVDDKSHAFYLKLMSEINRRHLPLLCINPDINRFTPQGIQPSVGFYGQYFQSLGGLVEFIGKPDSLVYEYTMNEFHLTQPHRIVMIGDSIHHDVLGASTMNIDSVLVRSGIHKSLFDETESLEELLNSWHQEGLPIPSYLIDQVK